jgi:M6 family metalloprotease-like protein
MRFLRSLLRRPLARLALLLALPLSANAADVEGVLTVRWGDPLDGKEQIERLQAEIVGKSGHVYPVAAQEALEAGHSLFELSGRPVVAALDARRKSDGGYRLQGMTAKAGSAPEPVADARPWVNLLCKFADLADEPTTAARMDAAFAPEGAMTGYWNKVSGGFVDLSATRTLGWFVLPEPRSAYIDANNNPNLNKLLLDCAAAAGTALAEQVQATDHAGINVLVNGSLGCCAWGGNAHARLGGVSKTWRVTWVPPSGYLNIALFGHELGHAFGMAHSNNSDGDGSTYDNPWDLLSDASGHAVQQATFGRVPKTPAAHHLDRAGWLDADEKQVVGADERARVSLQRIDRSAPGAVRMLKIEAPEWNGKRYFTLEARMRAGNDAALPDEGVVLYEVNNTRAQPAWLVDANDPAAGYSNTRSVVFKPGDRYVAPDRSFELRVLAASSEAFEIEVTVPGPGFGSSFE